MSFIFLTVSRHVILCEITDTEKGIAVMVKFLEGFDAFKKGKAETGRSRGYREGRGEEERVEAGDEALRVRMGAKRG